MCEQLVSQGAEILARNLRCVRGELDLVIRQSGSIVVCEVKTLVAGDRAQISPFDSIGPRKRAQIRRVTAAWLAGEPAHDCDGDRVPRPPPAVEVRFDAFAVIVTVRTGEVTIERVEGAF